jgi:MFS family permease
VGLISTVVLMIWIIVSGFISLNITFIIFFWVVKFLSGFGLILGIANGFLIVLDKTKDKIGKRGTNIIIILQIVIPIVLIIYAIDKIISSYYGTGGFSMTGIWSDIYVWIDNIIYIYGILSLLLTLYIIPIARDEIDEAVELGKFMWWKKKVKKVGRGVKKKYFRLKKDFAQAQIQDQMTVKEVLDVWRRKFAINLLLVLAVDKYENISLLVSMIWVGIVATVSPFFNITGLRIYETILPVLWTINIFYLIGIILGSIIFIRKLLILQGITIQALKLRRKEKQIDKLKREKEELKQKLKDKTNESEKR